MLFRAIYHVIIIVCYVIFIHESGCFIIMID